MKSILILSFISLISGCSTIISSATNNMAGQLTGAIMSSDDIQTVRDGIPAYMLLLDGFINEDPENEQTLMSAATLYAAYSSIFVDDPVRQQKMARRAHEYSLKGACLQNADYCDLTSKAYDEFLQIVNRATKDDLDLLFSVGNSWAAYIQAASSDWKVVANLPKVRALMERIVEVDGSYKNGEAHYYLGIIYSLIPPALGGKPEQALHHFQKAQQLSGGKNLMIKVTLAERYARVIFDSRLHDRLLNEVIDNSEDYPEFRLMNTLAKEKAIALLKSGDDFF